MRAGDMVRGTPGEAMEDERDQVLGAPKHDWPHQQRVMCDLPPEARAHREQQRGPLYPGELLACSSIDRVWGSAYAAGDQDRADSCHGYRIRLGAMAVEGRRGLITARLV